MDCGSLEVFRLRSSRDSRPETPHVPSESKVVHPRLRTIICEDAPANTGLFAGLLGCLVAPALSTLEFIRTEFIHWHERYTLQSILLFIRNSGAELASLTLYKIECTLQGLLDLSALIPMVTKLDLYGISDDLLQLLTIKADSPRGILFPHLERLVIRYNPTAHYDPELSYCSDMFHSRIYLAPNTTIIETMSPLQHAEVHLRSLLDCSILDFGEFHRGRYDLQRLMQCLRSVYLETTGRRRGDLTEKERVIRFVNRRLLPAQRELGYYAGRLPARETLRFFRKLETAFTALERYPITHVLEVLGNKIDIFMRAFSCIPEKSFLHHPKYTFHIRAANFLKRWDPIISEYRARDRWVCESDFMKVTSSHKVVHRRFVQ
ncbi:hypothetical protein BD779DRAFT_1679816 [Infundibulicybe gibba]|nr:hypothetical protein BD779DRAFT_1679816 [Infundibulicybe gibba]